MKASFLALALPWCIVAGSVPTAFDTSCNVKYEGVYRSEVETFLGIHYGEDTSGANRLKNPKPYTPTPGSTITAQEPGPACPQQLGPVFSYPFYLANITDVSEDCLSLNVYRPMAHRQGTSYQSCCLSMETASSDLRKMRSIRSLLE